MTIRHMIDNDLDFCVENVTREGWLSETRETFVGFFAHDPNGCLIAEEDSHPVGMCIATAYDTCGFLGELIVVPGRRGHGLGQQLMEHAIAYLRGRGCESIYLDGDTPAVPLYERLGFRKVCRSLRFLGKVAGAPSQHVRAMTADDLGTIVEMDTAAFGADRSFFLKFRFKNFSHLCQTLLSDNRVVGFVMGQPGHGVVTVGPWLVQQGPANPCDLLHSLGLKVAGAHLRVGVLESNTEAIELIRSLGSLTETEPSWRMVLGPDIGLGDSSRLFAVGSPAKG